MNDGYEVKVTDTISGTFLCITQSGYSWDSILIRNPRKEIPQIIDVLKHSLASIERDTSIPVQPEKRGRGKLFKEVKKDV